MRIAMLTTVDNPHSPFEDWDAWYLYDLTAGHHTPGLLARIAVVSHELSEKDFNLAIEEAIDEIVSENVSGIHKKVVKETATEPETSS